MDNEAHDQLRREVRAAVFRAGRLRLAGRTVEADEQLAGELAAAQAQLATQDAADPAGTVRRWHEEQDNAFALAQLIGEIVVERLAATANPPKAPDGPSPLVVSPAAAPATAIPQSAFPPPPANVPGLADLLDEMLTQQRRPPPPPR